jgi:hypothetical protein
MRRMRVGAVVAAAVVVANVVLFQRPGIGKPAAVPVTFSHGSVVDVQRLGAEPQIHIDGDGNVYTAAPIGVQYATSFFWKSEDHGNTWDLLRAFPPLQRPAPSGGSGDTDFAILAPAAGHSDDAVVWTDMVALADIASAATFNGGNTFPPDYWNDLNSTSPGADRQWNTSIRLPGTTTDRVYTFFDNYPAVGMSVIYSDDYGKSWVDGEHGFASGNPGNIVADSVHQKLYTTWGDGSQVMVASSDLDATSFTPVVAATGSGDVATLFTVIDVDTDGNLYVVWADQGGDRGVYLATSTDQGQSWSDPIKVSTDDLKANVFPWVVAGDAGRIWVTWYGSQATGGAPSNRGPWNVYAAQSLNALEAAPTFGQFKVNEHPIHDNEICLSGIGCTAGQGEDRNMLDDFTSDIDPRGMLHVTYNDTNNQVGASLDADAGGAFIVHSRQISGPSLYTSVGSVVPKPRTPTITRAKVSHGQLHASGDHKLHPGNWRDDPLGDAGDPRHGNGCPCPNNPVLDLDEVGMLPGPNGSATATLEVANLPAPPPTPLSEPVERPSCIRCSSWSMGRRCSRRSTRPARALPTQAPRGSSRTRPVSPRSPRISRTPRERPPPRSHGLRAHRARSPSASRPPFWARFRSGRSSTR